VHTQHVKTYVWISRLNFFNISKCVKYYIQIMGAYAHGSQNSPPYCHVNWILSCRKSYCFFLSSFGCLQASKISVGVRSIFCIVEKTEAKWWNKLVRDDQKAPHFVKVDWDKWVDEDDDGMLPTKCFIYRSNNLVLVII
jgi:hypothetical protein